MKLSLIIIPYKSMKYIPALLKSIETHLSSIEHEVIIVDNNSGDTIQEYVTQNHPKVIGIYNKDNKGYSGGMNQGYKVSTGEYVVFMNPDMEFVMNPFERLISLFESQPNYGLIAPQLRYEDGSVQPTVKNSPSLFSQVWILLKLHHLYVPKSLRAYWAKGFDYSKSQNVSHLMGAFLFTSRKRAQEIGLWDESYPLLWEDEDICETSLEKGFVNFYCADVHVMHYEGRSFALVAAPSKQKRFNFGVRLYFKKHSGWIAYCVLLALHPISMAMAYAVNWLKIKPKTQSTMQ